MQKNHDAKLPFPTEIKKPRLIVQKYGGATLATPELIKQVALRIHQLHKTGTQVVVVVSAMGQTTNQLIELARNVSPNPHLRELDMLLTVGERISMSLLSMALNDLGCNAISYTGSQAGILTNDSHVNASIIDVKAFRVEEALKQNKIVILAGFQGVSAHTKEITTLGRGGSDTSAVAMAGYLKADRCEILKDVSAIYTADPKIVSQARPITHLNYDHLLEMTKWGAKVLHHKSVEMAKNKNVPLYVGSAADTKSIGTFISAESADSKNEILAVNSFSDVLGFRIKKITLNITSHFFDFLNKKQIASPEILYIHENIFYVSGPKENLNLIGKLTYADTNFELINKDFASASLSCDKTPSKEIILRAEKEMNAANLKIEKMIITHKNINFLLHKKNKNQAQQVLHRLIDEAIKDSE